MTSSQDTAKLAAADTLDGFMSYSHRDRERVRQIVAAAASNGRTLWIDADGLPAGAPWRAELGTAIEAADAFVSCLSPFWVTSTECQAEYRRASELGKRVIPLLLEDTPNLTEELQALQWIDARDGARPHAVAEELLGAIDTNIGRVREHTHWLSRALRWENKQRDRSLLLRGQDLRDAEEWLHSGALPAPSPIQTEFILISRQTERRRRLRNRITAMVAVITLVAAAVVIGVIRHSNTVNHQLAQSRALASFSQSQLSLDPERSLLLALAAWKTYPSSQALQALETAYGTPHLARTLRVGKPGEFGVDWSSDHDSLLGIQSDGIIRAFNPTTGAVKSEAGLKGQVYAKSTASSGNSGAIVLMNGASFVWALEAPGSTLKMALQLTSSNAKSVAMSPDGKVVAVGMSDGTIKRWTLANHVETDVSTGRGGGVTCVAIAPDDNTVVAGTGDGTALVGNVAGEFRPFAQYRYPVATCGIGGGGKQVVTVAFDGTGTLSLLPSGTLVKRLPGIYQAVTDRTGRYLVVADVKNGITLYDLAQGTAVSLQPETALDVSGFVAALAFSPDGTMVADASLSGGNVWTVAQGKLVERLGISGESFESLAFSPAGDYIASSTLDGMIDIWPAPQQKVPLDLSYLGGTNAGAGQAVVFTPDGRTVITAADVLVSFSDPGSGAAASVCPPAGICRSLGAKPYYQLLRLNLFNAVMGLYSAVAYSPDDRFLAVASRRGTVVILDLRTAKTRTIQVMLSSKNSVLPAESLAFSPTGEYLAITYLGSRTARLVSLDGLNPDRSVTSRSSVIDSVVYLPGGQLVTGGDSGVVELWSADGKYVRGLGRLGTPVYSMSADKAHDDVAVTTGPNLAIIHVPDSRVLKILPAGVEGLRSVSYAPDGNFVAAGGSDGQAQIWDVANSVEAENFQLSSSENGIAFSPDGKHIAVANEDGSGSVLTCQVCTSPGNLASLAEKSLVRHLTSQEMVEFGLSKSP